MSTEAFRNRLTSRASAAGVDLSFALAAQLEMYYRLLARWNASINLTALRLDPVTDQALDRLLVEPLLASRHVESESPEWFDLGSGGGSPAIPLKLARPSFRLTMVESKERKAAFLREAIRVLRLDDASVDGGRIDDVASANPLSGAVELITVRAVRIDTPLYAAMRTLLCPGGRAVLFGARKDELVLPRAFEVVEPAIDTLVVLRTR
jgi:16S rRNA (guanine527-N7)-methyltransferase